MLHELDATLVKRRELTFIGYFLLISGIMLAFTNKGHNLNIIGICLYLFSGIFLYRYARLVCIFMWGSFMGIINLYLFLPRMLLRFLKKNRSFSTKATKAEKAPGAHKQTRTSYKFTIFTIPVFRRTIYFDLGTERFIIAGFYVTCIGIGIGISLGFVKYWACCAVLIFCGFIICSLGFIWPMLREKQTFGYILHRVDVDELNDLAFNLPNQPAIGLLFFSFPLLLVLDIFYLCSRLQGIISLSLLLLSEGLLYGFCYSSSYPGNWRAGISILLIGSFIIVSGLMITLLLRKDKFQHNSAQPGA